MKGNQPQQTIVDYIVLSLASQENVATSLQISDSTPYWEVKKKVIETFGESIFAEVRRLAYMPWEKIAQDNFPMFAAYSKTGLMKMRDQFHGVIDKLLGTQFQLEKLTPQQKRVMKEIITSIQREWISCLPQPPKLL